MAMPCLKRNRPLRCKITCPHALITTVANTHASAQTMVTEMAATIMFCTDNGNCSGGKVCSVQTLVNAMAARHTFCTHTVTSVTFNNFGQILVKAIHATNTMAV